MSTTPSDVPPVAAHGWKTYLAGAAAIIGGLALILVQNEFEAGLASIVAGLGIIGIGGKLSKLIELMKVIAAKRQ